MLACIPVSPAAAALFAPESDGFAVAVHSVEEVTAIRGVADLRFGGCVSVFRAADREMVRYAGRMSFRPGARVLVTLVNPKG